MSSTTATHAALYQYTSLTANAPNTIRLLTVRPSSSASNSVIQCHLHPVRLPSKFPFKALSYTWGTASPTQLISINGLSFFIRPNLHGLLRRLQSQSSPTRIWIDAICVNQADLVERSAQVRLMGLIYRAASSVIAWLGPSTDILTTGLPIFLDEHRRSLLSLYLLPPPKNAQMDVVQTFKSDYSPQAQAALETLSTNPYWSRTWIVQELVLASHPIIWYGDSGTLLFEPLRDWKGTHPPGAEAFTKVLSLRSNAVANLSLPLLHFIQVFRQTHCADPRDKVYAFLSIARDKDVCRVQADYMKPLRQLHEELVRHYGGQHARNLAEAMNMGENGYDKALDTYVLPGDPDRKDKSREQISLTLSESGNGELDWSMIMNQQM